jgi:phosphoglycolate phosphatase
MKFKAAIFDLDGTLLDTLEDIAAAMNTALGELGIAPYPVEEYRLLVGQGLERLAYKVVPENLRDESTVARCLAAMRREYGRIWSRKTRPYEGIPGLLQSFADKNIKTAVFSNKADDFAKKNIAHFFSAHHFDAVLGASSAFPVKPDPAGALHIASHIGVLPRECCFIGDSDIDMKTAGNAGMYPVGVLWGFRGAEELLANGAKLLVNTPAEILAVMTAE